MHSHPMPCALSHLKEGQVVQPGSGLRPQKGPAGSDFQVILFGTEFQNQQQEGNFSSKNVFPPFR